MKYTEVHITLNPIEPYRDLLLWALGDEGPYDSFQEVDDGLMAYVPSDNFDEAFLQATFAEHCEGCEVDYSSRPLPDKDWNESWERQHKPVLVDAGSGVSVWVRAPFHEHRSDVTYEVVIEPKMAFGTAHHATTCLMLGYLARLDVAGKRVLDLGSGTGVLGILAAMRGASHVDAVDVDEWAYANAMENARCNNASIFCHLGDAGILDDIAGEGYDIILANINRNILLRDMSRYISVLRPGGTLLLSGFYINDVEAIRAGAEYERLQFVEQKDNQNWSALRFVLPRV